MRGVDISFLSVYPQEQEYLYPPLTYLSPTGRRSEIVFKPQELGVPEGLASDGASTADGTIRFTIIEVEPQMS